MTGPTEPESRAERIWQVVAELRRENEELQRQLRLLTVSNALLTSIAEQDPTFAEARAAVDRLTS